MKARYSFPVCLSVLTLSSFFFLTASPSYAESSRTASASVTVGAACTFTAVENTAHTATIPAGTNRSDIGQTTFSMVCNDSGGFSIYAIGYGSNELGNTKLVAVINGATAPSYDINTGTNASGTPSSWAMKLTPGTNLTASNILNGYGSYSAVPSSYTKVATLVPTTSIIATSSLSATYRVNIAATQPAGNYNGKVRFVMVNPENDTPVQPQTTTAGQICYYKNASDALGTMGCQTIPSSGGSATTVTPTSATLLASNFSRDGYGFAGWSTTYDYSDPNGFYGPQEYITFTAGTYSGSNPGFSLYAHWIKSAGSLQEWSGCSALQEGAVTALTDQRDNETYAVAKLADGKCWMIENLRLENDTTDNATGALAQGYETGFTGLADPEAPWTSTNSYTTVNSLYSIDGSTANTISGSNPTFRFPHYNNVNTPTAENVADRPSDPTTNDATNSTSNAGMYSYGNYYTWAAAAANTTETSTNDYNTKSICPKGWSLPRGGDKSREATNDFWNLVVTGLNNGTKPANYGSQTRPYYDGSTEGTPVSNALRAYPNNFVYSGNISISSVYYRGSSGYYWSSTTNGSASAYGLYLYSTRVYPGTLGDNKIYGWSIRCIVPSV